ncbi:MAG: shikimate dehydrogenase [Actinomycetota bacterium]|nr:shikimate dehydrogenase [Actinomycetota bacterium]
MGDGRIGGATRVVGVLGWPIDHSLSPVIHNAAFDALGLDWVYVALPVSPDDVPAAVAGLAALGFAGANVTMPHKEAVAIAVDRLSEDAERLRAVNTIEFGVDGLIGHNTDAPGFARFLERDAAFDADGRTALLYGAGGAARACALALARAGLTRLVVALRVPARSKDLAAALDGFPTTIQVVGFDEAADVRADLIVNGTPLGVHGETLPLPPLDASVVAVDLLYRPMVTAFQQAARAAGGSAFGGLGMLLHQAGLSFEIWTGHQPPLEVMSAAALAAMTDA